MPRTKKPRPNRIQAHLRPRRGLSRRDEDALVSWLDYWRADQIWTWEGEALSGQMCTDDEFSVGDVLDHLCVLGMEASLVQIDLSEPYAEGQRPSQWLRVQRSHWVLGPLCRLYADRLLPVEAVVQALGGFR